MATPIEPHLWVDDLRRSVAWYQGALGFEPAAWFPDEEAATWCRLTRGEAAVMLAVVPDPAELAPNQQYLADLVDRTPVGALSLYLHVDDADAVYAAATAYGVEPIEEIWDAWWGGRQFTVIDPDGQWWTVFQATE